MYHICYTCRIIRCSHNQCESPSPRCQIVCLEVVNQRNVHYNFCKVCQEYMDGLLRKTLRELNRKQLPKIRTEEG